MVDFRHNNLKARRIIVLLLLTLVQVSAALFLVKHETETSISGLKLEAENHIEYLVHVIQTDVFKNNIDPLNSILEQWVNHHADNVLELNIVGNDGAVIYHYHKEVDSKHSFSFTKNFHLPQRSGLVQMAIDLSPAYTHRTHYIIILGFIIALSTITVFYISHLVSRQKMLFDNLNIRKKDLRQKVNDLRDEIEKRKQIEQKLEYNERKFKALFDNTDDCIFYYSPEGKMLEVNQAACRRLGYSYDELMQLKPWELNSPNCRNISPELSQELYREGKVSFELELNTRDGQNVPVEIISNYFTFDEKPSIICSVRDISMRRKSEQALRVSEERYRSMLEAIEDAVYICSPEYKIEYMNPALIEKLGRDATGEQCFKAIFNQDEKCPWCVLGEIEENRSVESNIYNPKENRSYHVFNSLISHGDKPVSMMAILKDTTERHKLEKRLIQTQKMEAIGTLAAGIAHDFNNILFAIIGYTEILLMDCPENSPTRNSLDKILLGANRAKELILQILVFSRQSNLELKPIKIKFIIKEALKLLKSTLPSTIEIKENIKNDCGPVMADVTQIHQIIINLITNAYQSIPDGKKGKITIDMKQVELAALDCKYSDMNPGLYNCITLADNGTGIQKEIINNIFDPYFTTKEKGKGTGLGLSVTHGIVRSHGGQISVYSEIGKGTEFQVYLPVTQSLEKEPSIQINTPIQKGDERILFVDDEQILAQMGKEMLERLGYRVTVRTSSLEALEAFRNHPNEFDLVVTDMTMPNMTGDQLATELLKIRPDIPIILSTGFSETMTSEKAKSLGIRAFLMKPIIVKDLSSTIRKVIEDTF